MRNKLYLPLVAVLVCMFLWTVYAHEQKTSDGKQHVWVDNILTAQATSQTWKYKVVVHVTGGLDAAWYEDNKKLTNEPPSALAKITELGSLDWELVSTTVKGDESSGRTVWTTAIGSSNLAFFRGDERGRRSAASAVPLHRHSTNIIYLEHDMLS